MKVFKPENKALEKHENNVLLWIWISSSSGKNSNISTMFPAGKTFFFFSFFFLLSDMECQAFGVTNCISLPVSQP